MIGYSFGELIVEQQSGFAPNGSSKVRAWLCRCSCGNTRRVAEPELKRGSVVSCGCKSRTAKKQILGQRFGMWTVIADAPKKSRRTQWICRCDCGAERSVLTIHLVRETSTSCGCDRPRGPESKHYKHGSDPALYGIWCNIIQRCENANNPNYKSYGGRGIGICARWRNDFAAFAADMGERPSKDHSIDRVDNDKGYDPGNCRWATPGQQMRNTRRNNLVVHEGKIIPLIEATEATGVNYGTAKWRLRNGRSFKEALKP